MTSKELLQTLAYQPEAPEEVRTENNERDAWVFLALEDQTFIVHCREVEKGGEFVLKTEGSVRAKTKSKKPAPKRRQELELGL